MAVSDDNSAQEITRLLQALRGADRSAAWRTFLDRYAGTIHHLAARYEHDPDRRSECFLFVCEKLVDNDFGRLMKYRPDSSARFRSWLKVVVANLCIDWRRLESGRLRPFRCIEQLPSPDQAVFRYRFLQRLDPRAALALLQVEFPDLDEPGLALAESRINQVLTPKHRWLLNARHTRTDSLDDHPGWEPRALTPGPDELAEQVQEAGALDRALRALPARQQLLIRMRFEQDLPYREIARLMRLGDPFRARRQVDAAVRALAELLEAGGGSGKTFGRVR